MASTVERRVTSKPLSFLHTCCHLAGQSSHYKKLISSLIFTFNWSVSRWNDAENSLMLCRCTVSIAVKCFWNTESGEIGPSAVPPTEKAAISKPLLWKSHIISSGWRGSTRGCRSAEQWRPCCSLTSYLTHFIVNVSWLILNVEQPIWRWNVRFCVDSDVTLMV